MTNRVLIVEDDEVWSNIYRRSAKREGFDAIEVAQNLLEAENLLQCMSFAVAFVDVGLDVDDDRNVDGLAVMERLHALGDQTSIIVITGRSGRDVLPITRDAIMKYKAFYALGKAPVEPAELRRVLREGMQEFARLSAQNKHRAVGLFRGDVMSASWDDIMLRSLPVKGGVSALYELSERLFFDFLPALPKRSGEGVRLEPGRQLAVGEFWSRAKGVPVVVCFGEENEMKAVATEALDGRQMFGRYSPAEILKDISAGNLRGQVIAIRHVERREFA